MRAFVTFSRDVSRLRSCFRGHKRSLRERKKQKSITGEKSGRFIATLSENTVHALRARSKGRLPEQRTTCQEAFLQASHETTPFIIYTCFHCFEPSLRALFLNVVLPRIAVCLRDSGGAPWEAPRQKRQRYKKGRRFLRPK